MASKHQRSHEHPFLRAMVPEHRCLVLQGAQQQDFGADEILFREGQPANRLYLIQEGKVMLETHVHGKGAVEVVSAGSGQVLGWSWLVAPYVWHFQARAIESSRTWMLDGGHLLVASEQNHYLGYELMKNISKVILEVLLAAHQRWLQTGHHPLVQQLDPGAPAPFDRTAPTEGRLGAHPFFHGLPPNYLSTLAPLATVKEYEPGQQVFETGGLAEGLYLIEHGRLVLEADVAETALPVQVIRSGEGVGWSAFCEPYEWQFSARAIDPTLALFFKAAELRERFASDYHLGYELTKRITRMMLQRLQATRNRMWEAFR